MKNYLFKVLNQEGKKVKVYGIYPGDGYSRDSRPTQFLVYQKNNLSNWSWRDVDSFKPIGEGEE